MDDARNVDAKRILQSLNKRREKRAKLASNEALRYRYESQEFFHVPFGIFASLLSSLTPAQLEKIAQRPQSLSDFPYEKGDPSLFYTHSARIIEQALAEENKEKETGSHDLQNKTKIRPLHRVALGHLGKHIFPFIDGDHTHIIIERGVFPLVF